MQDAKQLDDGLELSALGNKDATGRLMFQTTAIHSTLPSDLPMGKADNQILGVVRALQEKYPQREVVLVSKDINMRLKARALGMAAEDYNDHVLEDSDLMYSGVMQLPDFWNKHGKNVESWQQGGTTFYRIHGPLCAQFVVNQFVYFEGQMPLARRCARSGKTAVLATLRDTPTAEQRLGHHRARAGPGTKVICLGNIAQIDTPYLTEGSSGLTFVVDRFRAGRTRATSRCSAASARGWRTTRATCSDLAFVRKSPLIQGAFF